MDEMIAGGWEEILAYNRLNSFDALWDLEADWFEPPNRRRGGWSGVFRARLEGPDGRPIGVFVKRQENHGYRTLRHPLRGRPTFLRELRNIQRYQDCGVPALEPVYFAWRSLSGNQQSILVTRELTGFRSLWEMEREWEQQAPPPWADRMRLLDALADLTRRMHACGLQHNCFYPKHLFLRQQGGGWEVRVIDLEKTKRRWPRSLARVRDLSTLGRYAQVWTRSQRLRFFLRYLEVSRLTPAARRLLRRVLRDIQAKQG